MLKEWPLVAFTILGQMAVGAFLLLCPLLFLTPAGTSWPPTARRMVLVVWGMTLGFVVIAAGLSFFHLRHPFRARRVLVNFRTGQTSGLFLRAVIAAAAVAGILFLASMGRLYRLESVPPWDAVYIGGSFFLTVMILGAMAAAWVTRSPLGDGRSYLSALWTAALFFLIADVLFAAFLTPVFGLAGYRPKASLRPPARVSRWLHFGRLVLLAAGMIFVILTMVAPAPGPPGPAMARPAGGPGPLLTLAFALVLASEVAGRFLFYGLAPRPGD
jgi:anaerobic dimethyl sulfoxide reductase subunit C (anchor subunit)